MAGVIALLLVTGVLGVFTGTARADSAPADPAAPATPTTVTADGLPTVQINGVAWSQVVVGDTVYVAGKFTSARPAGAPAGTQETVRNNLLAYDIRTGELVTSFAPDLNAQALVVTASPDGSRVYVGGDFSQANGQTRYRVAAYSTATGELVAGFQPSANGRVNAIAATDSTVYLGGTFSAIGSTARARLAAVSASTGALQPWAPVPGVGSTAGNTNGNTSTSDAVRALVVTGGGTQVVAAGSFDSLNGVKATGVGALDPVSGATRPFAINELITNQGVNSAVYSLSTDGTTVYGTAFDFYGPGNLEGSFAAAADGGAVQWVNDCHGDTYSSFPSNGALYMATHAHVCSNIGGYPEESPRINKFATAVSLTATGTVGTDTLENANLAGQPAPSLQTWFPTMSPGSYTGQNQAGWTVSGNDEYVVYGGEFPQVNGVAQQGLVRYAFSDTAPNRIGPSVDGLTPTVTALAPGAARVAWTASSDQDNAVLTYRVHRDGDMTTPVHEVTRSSTFWDTPVLAFVDTGVSAGQHTYRVTVSDPFGNRPTSAWVPVTVTAGATPARPYAAAVVADGAQSYWPLGEATGRTGYDWAGRSDLTLGTGVTTGQAGAVQGDADTAARFSGTSSGLAATTSAVAAPDTFTVEAWFATTTRLGGKVIGFGSKSSGTSGSYDRHVYLDSSGRLTFGVHAGSQQTIRTTGSYNDGQYHHVVAQLSSAGMALYVDGELIGAKTGVTEGRAYRGYWRIGGDTTWGNNGTWFAGTVDEVAVYPTALSADVVASHHSLGTTGKATNVAPVATYTAAATFLDVALDASASTDRDGSIASWDWTFGDGSSGSGATTAHSYAAAGTYPVTLTVTDDQGASSTHTTDVTVQAEPPNAAPTAAFTATGTGLAGSFDAAASTDADGTVAEYRWDLGDGSTATGRTTSHTYAAGGTYTVTLTVVDDDGATGTTTQELTVAAAAVHAADGFSRTVASGLGTAEVGGAWTASAPARSSVADGAAHLQTGAGQTSSVFLDSVAQSDVTVQAKVSLGSVPTGGGAYVSVVGRHVGTSDYRLLTRYLADGRVLLTLSRLVDGVQTDLRGAWLPGTYTAGTALQLRFDVSGTSTAALKAKAWVDGTTEPTAWQVSTTDTTAALQAAGGVGLSVYLSSSATSALRLDLDDVWAGRSGQTPTDAVNQAPTAAFTDTVTGLRVAVDGTGSSDVDGVVAGLAWDFGDGTTVTGATATHTYAAAGTYRVRLTVTDEDGATGTTERSVTVTDPPVEPPADQSPTAVFTSAVADLAVTVDGSGSSDPDGPVAAHDWDFGDGTTASGMTATHTYTAAGTYPVTLTVTDAVGSRATTSQDVTVTAPATPPPPAAETPLAADAFGRELAAGWGTADVGGAWTTSGWNATASVTGGAGVFTAPPGHTVAAVLPAVSSQDVALQASIMVPQATTGGGTYVELSTRRVGTTEYQLMLLFRPTGEVQMIIVRVVDGVETALVGANLPGTYTPGTPLTVRFDTAGNGTTTLKAKAWATGTTEPAAWTLTRTDATASLQRPGAVAVSEYVSGAATASSTVQVDDLWLGAAGTAPAAG